MKQQFSREFGELDAIVAMTVEVFARHQIDSELRNVVDLATEELFTNMVKYNTESQARIDIEMQPIETGVSVTLTDHDVERFDPTAADPVNVDAPADQRTPGGLGIYLVMRMVDSIQYEYDDRSSKITFKVTTRPTNASDSAAGEQSR